MRIVSRNLNWEKNMSSAIRAMLSVAFAAASLTIAIGVQAADRAAEARAKVEDASGVVKINEVLCKDITRFSGEDRVIALGVLHGYYLGKKGATQYATNTLARASDEFIEYCLDNPRAKALEAFGKFAK